MSLIAMVENVIVEKYKRLTHEEILDGITIANLLPGPMAVNVVAFVGYRLKGALGALVCATAVILPSFILVIILSHLYFYNSSQINLTAIFAGITPAVAGIILFVAYKMLLNNAKEVVEYILVGLALLIILFSSGALKLFTPFILIIIYAFIGYYLFYKKEDAAAQEVKKKIVISRKTKFSILFLVAIILLPILSFASNPNSILNLGATFGGLSLMLFGGGYVFIPMIQEVVVQQYHWLTNQQFIDGIAIGQFTPGPIVITVAFIGYYVKGILGALVATIAIFTPPAVLMILASKVMDFLKYNKKVKAALKGVRLGIIGMIFYSVYVISQNSLNQNLENSILFFLILMSTFVFLKKFNVSIIWVIVTSGILGYFLF